MKHELAFRAPVAFPPRPPPRWCRRRRFSDLTDRPGFCSLTPKGWVQIEAGLLTLTIARDSGDDVRTRPSDRRRYGVENSSCARRSRPDRRARRHRITVNDEGFGDSSSRKWAPGLRRPLVGRCGPDGDSDFTTDEVAGRPPLARPRLRPELLQTMLGATHARRRIPRPDRGGASRSSQPVAERSSAYVEGTAPRSRNAPDSPMPARALCTPTNDLQLDSADWPRHHPPTSSQRSESPGALTGLAPSPELTGRSEALRPAGAG
jgi:hypothetical protein